LRGGGLRERRGTAFRDIQLALDLGAFALDPIELLDADLPFHFQLPQVDEHGPLLRGERVRFPLQPTQPVFRPFGRRCRTVAVRRGGLRRDQWIEQQDAEQRGQATCQPETRH
jgi:hypothetical protein